MKNKFILLITTLMLIIIYSGFSNLNAEKELYVTTDENAAIRYKTENSLQGLKFTAKLDEAVKNNRHGFFLVYGKTTINDLRSAINDSRGKSFYINEKVVYKKEVPGATEKNTFSIVLTGIPSWGYIDKISAISYVEVNGVIRYSDNVVVKSVADVAFKNLNYGIVNDSLNEIVNDIEHKIVYQKNVLNEIELNNTFYEYNHRYLEREFNKDFNKILNKDFLGLLTEEDDLINFYNAEYVKEKWSFLLDYFNSLSENENLNEQIANIKMNVKSESIKELIYAHTNFFNEENNKIDKKIIDFTDLNNYLSLKDYNDKIYINLDDYDLYQVGEEFILPEIDETDEGHLFSHYLIAGSKYFPLDKYVLTNKSVIIKEVYEFFEYEISFVDEDNNIIDSINVLHNGLIGDFPELKKEDFVLVGWENDNNEVIDEMTKITEEMILRPIFKKAIKEINIIVNKSNGGVITASENITYEYTNYNDNLHFLYLRPLEGYAFIKEITISVTFADLIPVKREIFKVQTNYIEYAYDDPYWSEPY